MCFVEDVHYGLPLPSACGESFVIKGHYDYYHYMCDEVDDRGWGCGYRTLQTMCSWIQKQLNLQSCDEPILREVPSIKEIQQALVELGDKTPDFIGSNQWIGSFEVSYCLEKFYEVSSRIFHARTLKELSEKINLLVKHFETYGSPVMMGGDHDNSSKGILGVCCDSNDIYLLVLDPHYSGNNCGREQLQYEGWIKWRSLSTFDGASFYNLCCPLLRA